MTELWNAVDRYFASTIVDEDEALRGALAANAAAGMPAIDVSPSQGKLLHLLARIRGAMRILEIGTLGGYSTIWMARALPERGRLVSLEVDPKHAEIARANLERAGVGDRVEIRVGPARESLAAMTEERFDMAFIDADKASTADYFAAVLDLSTPGATVVVDNVVRDGAILDDPDASDIRGLRAFFDLAASDPRVTATAIQTVGTKGHDGLAIAVIH